jgi:hypothetical protein
VRTIAVTITLAEGRMVINTPLDLPDGTYQAVVMIEGSADQLQIMQGTSGGVLTSKPHKPIDPAVLNRRIQSVGKTNFVLLCAALIQGSHDDQALMDLLPSTNADDSKRSIISTARRLVDDGHVQEVLIICLQSNLPETILAEARRLSASVH